ncbi:MAG: hypothetical protein ABSB71_07915 [Candidatus Bathyarchaeia archaeon]|jgi:hypothetical protein
MKRKNRDKLFFVIAYVLTITIMDVLIVFGMGLVTPQSSGVATYTQIYGQTWLSNLWVTAYWIMLFSDMLPTVIFIVLALTIWSIHFPRKEAEEAKPNE